MVLLNPFPKDFEEDLSIFFHKYHPLNTRWHRWPPQGWMRAQVHRTGWDLFIQLICGSWKASPGASPPHPSLCFVTDTDLSSCFIFQQPLGQNKLKSSPRIFNSLIKDGNTLINKCEEKESWYITASLSVVPHLPYFAVQAAPKLCLSERWTMPHKTSVNWNPELCGVWVSCQPGNHQAGTSPSWSTTQNSSDGTGFQSPLIWTPLLKRGTKIGWLDISISSESLGSRKTGGRVNSFPIQLRITSFLWNV